MAFKQGIDAFFARNTGNWNTPTWSEIEIVADLTPEDGWDAAEIKTRQSPVKFGAKTMIGLGFTVRVLCDDTDAGYTAMLTAYRAKSATMDCVVLDGSNTTNGSFGQRAMFQVTGGSQPQPVDDVLYREFKFVPYPDPTNRPQFAEVVNGTLTFTTIT